MPYADITNPQSLNKYSYTYNNPLRYVDPDGHGPWEYLKGAANAFLTDHLLGAGRVESDNRDFTLGQAYGDGVAAAQGVDEVLTGLIGEGVGLELDKTGALTLAGVTVNVGSAVLIIDGTLTVVTATTHFAKSSAPKGSQGGPTAGQRFTPKERAWDAGKRCRYCGTKTTEKPGKPNSRETDHIHPRSRSGNRTPANRASACRTCNRSKGARTPREWKKAKKTSRE